MFVRSAHVGDVPVTQVQTETGTMAWMRMKGIKGLVYEPEVDPQATRKHHCKDCFCCRMCRDVCCIECLKRKAGRTGGGCGRRKPG